MKLYRKPNPSFCHTFCAVTLLAHCRPRSCGRQRAKADPQTKSYAKIYRTVNRKKSLASQKLNLSRPLIADRKKSLFRDIFVNNKYTESTIDIDTKERTTGGNITYTQAGGSCFVGQESAIFETQFFVGNLVVKIPACV